MPESAFANTADAQQALAQAGLRATAPRMAIWQMLCQAEDEPDAVELLCRARSLEPGTSLGTVYRFLRELEQHGLATSRLVAHQRARWRMGMAEESTRTEAAPAALTAITQLAAAFGYRLVPTKRLVPIA
ncbi:transcriptional repressor [Dyella sp. 20L07]|uniref:transcriptional repressor n=1 Tax=Dyella sp. 20L07 TaxID=3384240 RepID=UPI003D2B71B3